MFNKTVKHTGHQVNKKHTPTTVFVCLSQLKGPVEVTLTEAPNVRISQSGLSADVKARALSLVKADKPPVAVVGTHTHSLNNQQLQLFSSHRSDTVLPSQASSCLFCLTLNMTQ